LIGRTISHYKILAKLGEGGMGVVYKAEDLDLKVTRALKFLPSHTATDGEQLARLKREAQSAASLEHPNICQVHEIGRADGQTFIVMSYLEGRTLEDRLTDEGPLPIADAIKIATEVGDALKRAHAAGIVHRDIKPANIMLTASGQTVVMDFGLAKSADLTRMTKTGTTLGTAAYMSPEQMQGQSVDARADLWALGVILYEMLTGRVPFGGDNLPAVAYAVQHREPESPTGIRAEVSADLERVIDRTLAKDPGQRYQTADELMGDLEAVRNEQDLARKTALYDHRNRLKRQKMLLLGMLTAAVVIAAGMVWWIWHQDMHRIDALAVLPFANLSGDKEQEYFSDGMTEALITELQQLASDQMRVVGRTSVMSFKGSNKTLPEIAAALGVDVVVEASVIRSGNLVKVAAKLIRARPQEQQLWADTYERNIADILSLYSELAREVATQIQIVLTPDAQARGTGSRVVDPDAYEAYLKGRHFLLNLDLAGVESGNPQALENFHLIKSFFTKSIQMDSTYAPAWAGLAQFHIQREHRGVGSHAIEEAYAAAARAIDLDDSLGEAHCAMGHILWEHQYRPREAEGEFRRALKMNPNDPLAHVLYSYCLMNLGRYQESTGSMRMALELDPLSRFINYVGFAPLANAGKYDEALRQLDKYHESYPDPQFYKKTKFNILESAGRYEEALVLIDELDPTENILELHLRVPPVLMALRRPGDARDFLEKYRSQAAADSLFFLLGRAEASVGNLDEARQWLDKSDEASNSTPMDLAKLSAMIGDLDRAFAYLEKAYDSNNWYLTRLAYLVENDPEWKVLGPDPRYHDLVQRMGLRD
jgi:TolB-like protein/Tfp pilus assembly protein PilF